MTFLHLFLTFFKIGLFTFGGGYAMLPLIGEEVAAHQWISSRELIDFIAVSESTPGPFAVNISTFIGRVTAGILGSFCATLGVVLPSFLVILVISKFYEKFRDSRLVKGAMTGLRPAVIGLIASALVSLGLEIFMPEGSAFDSVIDLIPLAIFLAMSVFSFLKKNPILVIVMSALIGVACGYGFGL
ncbi:MAG: chromate transporter [Lachnospiraceae bacterium]|nr:chromate transporter [Lachnospiraceae bacterium]